jgi:hypothetical protein
LKTETKNTNSERGPAIAYTACFGGYLSQLIFKFPKNSIDPYISITCARKSDQTLPIAHAPGEKLGTYLGKRKEDTKNHEVIGEKLNAASDLPPAGEHQRLEWAQCSLRGVPVIARECGGEGGTTGTQNGCR